VPAGQRLQLDLTDSGSVMLTSILGPGSMAIEGVLVSPLDSTYRVSVLVVHRRNGSDEDWKGERVVVPEVFVDHVTERHFSSGRTALFTAGIAGALALIHQGFAGPVASSPGSGSSGGTLGK
jgi:hypothetical protein